MVRPHRSSRKSLGLLIVLLALVAAGLLWQQQFGDWLRVWGYTPTAAVSSLAVEDGFTDKARHLYEINRPDVVAKTNFASHCAVKAEQTIVLGCYHGVQNGIYILQIPDDSRLQGVMQVTAAHEMLHAAYDRLSTARRQQVDGWLQDYYQHDLHDARIMRTIAAYKKTEPNAVVNEMHSIFGTEVAALPPNLEHYYAQYFLSRQKIVSYAAGYQAEFTKREQQVADYDVQLAALKQKITANEATLDSQAASLKAQAARLDQLRANHQTQAYNASVAPYNRAVDSYNALVGGTKSDIEHYNQLVAIRNKVALEQRQLTSELSGDNLSTIQ